MNIVMLLKPKDTIAYIYNDNTIRQALEKMKVHKYTAVPVIDDKGKYVGTVSEGDFLWHLLENPDEKGMKGQEKYRIRDILRKDFNPAVKISVTMDEVLEKAMNQNFIPVTDDYGSFIGIVTRRDIIAYFTNGKTKI